MDKRKAENIRVKNAIVTTLFQLMEKKELSKITITELIKKAHVARASFYRNYSSKTDVLVTLVHDILQDFRETADYDLSQVYSLHHVRRSFSYFQQYRELVLNVCRAGQAMMLLDELNQFHVEIAGNMPSTSTSRYTLNVYVGALFNTALSWLQDENAVDLEAISTLFTSVWAPSLNE